MFALLLATSGKAAAPSGVAEIPSAHSLRALTLALSLRLTLLRLALRLVLRALTLSTTSALAAGVRLRRVPRSAVVDRHPSCAIAPAGRPRFTCPCATLRDSSTQVMIPDS
eukprot:Amastigsp_a850832_12.p3 type:complete len:111 gc:universal Amastigsp_a850832_12:845-513(-)